MRKSILGVAAFAAIATPLALGAAANAYTIDAAGKGFVGKGEVQSAFGWANKAMQDNQLKITFSAEQPTTQALTQDAEQAGSQAGSQAGTMAVTQLGTQAGTQVVGQDLTCTFTNGNGTKVFHRDGVREGDRTGTREGTKAGVREGSRTGNRDGVRTGSQAGKQVGKIASTIDASDKKTGQYTGWFLNKYVGSPAYSTVGSPVWEAPIFGAYEFGGYTFGDYTFGDAAFGDAQYEFGAYAWEPVTGTEWGEWDALPGENPDDCLRSQNADAITQISNVITPGTVTDGLVTDGAIVDGAVTDGAITDGAITDGDVTLIDPVTFGDVVNDGIAKVFASFNGGTPKAL